MRRLGLYALAVLLFVALELTLLGWFAGRFGFLATLGVVVGSAAIGFYAGRAQGVSVLRRWLDAARGGEPAEEGLVDGLIVFVAAALWVVPGFLGDVLGAALFVPPVRRALAERIRRRAAGWVRAGDVEVLTYSNVSVDPRDFAPSPSFARPDVIDTVGEVVDEPRRERLLLP